MAQARRRLVERRQELGLTQQEVAELIGADVRTVGRHESGERTPHPRHRHRYAEAYGWSLGQLNAALNGDDPPVDSQIVHEWLTLYASLEQGAATLLSWQPFSVHGLLQTPGYAAAVERIGPEPVSEDAVTRFVELRLTRQAVLTRDPNPLHLDVVLDESVLLRTTGGQDVMVDQLEHLAEMAERPNIDLRILSLAAGIHAGAFGAFTLLASDATEPRMACVSDRTGPRYLEGAHVVEAHKKLHAHLRKSSHPPTDTPALIRRTIKEHYL